MPPQTYTNAATYSPEGSANSTGQNNNYFVQTGKEVLNLVKDLPGSKVYFILSIIIYGVIAYSKGELGVSTSDVTSYVVFSIFVILLYSITTHSFRMEAMLKEARSRSVKFFSFCKVNWSSVTYLFVLIIALLFALIIVNPLSKTLERLVFYLVN